MKDDYKSVMKELRSTSHSIVKKMVDMAYRHGCIAFEGDMNEITPVIPFRHHSHTHPFMYEDQDPLGQELGLFKQILAGLDHMDETGKEECLDLYSAYTKYSGEKDIAATRKLAERLMEIDPNWILTHPDENVRKLGKLK